MNKSITREELKQLLANKASIQVLDVRSPEEFDAGHIPFAINQPLPSLLSGEFLPNEKVILVTACGRGGGRANKAANYLKENFLNEVYTLEEGSLGWLDHEKEN
jgi:rhodanese-related sulfurtransferase